MIKIISDYISSLELGECFTHADMNVFPITREVGNGPIYLTFREAMEQDLMTVTEVDEGGSVPNLMVTSKAALPILILDGEELRGAKQNRVLNTSVLIPPKEKVIIPVSCTEQGRWSYVSPEFSDSGTVMPAKARSAKAKSVSFSLRESRSFESDQSEVWEEISSLHRDVGSYSETGAMSQAFEDLRVDLDEYVNSFPLQEKQIGLLVLVGGEVMGLDVLSRPETYAKMHEKLIRSYAMDALVFARSKKRKSKKKETSPEDTAAGFLEEMQQCREEKYDSVGLGTDYRYTGKHVAGSALEYQETVIHMAFFRTAKESDASDILRRRHRYGED